MAWQARGGLDVTWWWWLWAVATCGVSLARSGGRWSLKVPREVRQVWRDIICCLNIDIETIQRTIQGDSQTCVDWRLEWLLLGPACCLVLTDAPGNYCYYTMIDAMIYKLGYLQPHQHWQARASSPHQALYSTTTTTRSQLKKTPNPVRKYFGSLPKCNNRK